MRQGQRSEIHLNTDATLWRPLAACAGVLPLPLTQIDEWIALREHFIICLTLIIGTVVFTMAWKTLWR